MCWAKSQTNTSATKPLLTPSTIINSCLVSPAHQADSWYMEQHDAVIVDIRGQAL